MDFYSDNNNIKDAVTNKVIATALDQKGAEIVARALNFYFGDSYTRNNVVEMMHENTSDALIRIASVADKHEMQAKELIEWMREISDEMKAQALVVSTCEMLKIKRPNRRNSE